MENYTTYEITGFQNLKNLIKELNNDSTIIDHTYECESRGNSDDTHIYFVQVIRK